MKLLNNLRQHICILLTVGIISVVLGGCSIPDTIKDSLKEAFNSRSEANKSIANELYGAGLIREDTFNQIIKDVDSKLGGLADNLGDDNADMQNLLKACIGFRLAIEPDHQVFDKDGKPLYWFHTGTSTACSGVQSPVISKCLDDRGHGPQCPDFYNGFISNFLVANEKNNILQKNVPCIKGQGSPIKPIEVISESLVNEINEQLSIPVYVLKTDITSDEGVGLDQIVEAVTSASTEKDKIKAEQILAQYFEVAKYTDKKDNNKEKTLTVVDPADPEQQVVRITTQTYEEAKNISYNESGSQSFNPLKFSGTDIGEEYTFYNGTANFPSDSYGNQPGIDMTVSMSGEKVLAVRLIEFNQHAIEILKNRTGLSQNRYLVLNGRAYLMEYPLGYIDGFKESEDRASYKSIIKQSQLGFNLLTTEFVKFDTDSNGNITNTSTTISREDPYITFNGALSLQDDSRASLVLYGETGVTKDGEEVDPCNEPWDLQLGGSDENPYIVSTGRIVLRDYLEATYAPGVVAGDSLIVLGRKLRVLHLNGTKGGSEGVAQMFDKDGEPLQYEGQPIRLYINDFADIDALMSSSPKVKYISDSKETTGDVTGGTGENTEEDTGQEVEESDTGTDEAENESNSDSSSGSSGGSIQSSITKADRLPTQIVSEIRVSTTFPGPYIDSGERNNTDTKPLFYAMTVKKNIFETGLFSGWINNTDVSKNSLGWWNQWLQDHGFSYKINSDSLTEYLSGNYAFELTKEGIIVLDLQTISKIQEEFDRDEKVHTAELLHTIFLIFGYILVAYSIMLLIAWNVDVNVDLGFNILEKLSFGRWVAIKDYDELPYMNTDEVNYIKFGELLVSCIVIITTGIILITVNIVDLILMLIQLFGGLARYITGILTGR